MSNEGILKFDVFLNKIPGEDKDLMERLMMTCMNRGTFHRLEDRAVLLYKCFKAIYPDKVHTLFL
ncbi:hypothetical protein JYU34_004906 [Plutella xylostella]|uniref:Uncharacterized protein n=2 Tax=Plutella xylostella TaxID=51655 RepID=A0ABQ7QVH2_PLUXY|nr:hypothetical protein JYU34_004906 [Plutella xylostella]